MPSLLQSLPNELLQNSIIFEALLSLKVMHEVFEEVIHMEKRRVEIHARHFTGGRRRIVSGQREQGQGAFPLRNFVWEE